MKKLNTLLALLLAAGMLASCAAPVAPAPVPAPAEAAEAPAPAPAAEEASVAEEAPAMKDGSYTAQAKGFNLTTPVTVTVDIKDGAIADIEIGENGETNGMPQAVKAGMVKDIIDNQTLNVDVTTGATATSAAVRAAVQDCCKQAGADATMLKGDVAADTTAQEYTVDVVVVGMGGSGTAAALSAAQSGAKVLAIDKAGKFAGTSAITSGPMTVNAPSQVNAEYPEWVDPLTGETRVKKAGENLVDGEALYNTWIEYTTVDGVQGAKPEIVRQTIDNSGDTLDWLISCGFAFDPAKGFVGGKWGIFAPYTGNKSLTEDYFAAAYDKFTSELGGQYMLNTRGVSLIQEDGRVTGVMAKTKAGADVTIHAKSVILATGGFGGNAEMQKQYMGEDWKLYGMAQNTGDGIQMAIDAGAATYNIDMPPMSHFVAPPVIVTKFESALDNDIPYAMVATAEALAVSKAGARFCNESSLGMAAYAAGSRYFSIYSKEQIDVLRAQGFAFAASGRYLSQGGAPENTPLENIDAVLENGIDMGFIYKAATLDELATAIGGEMNADTLKASVAAYNAAAAGGEDAFKKDPAKYERLGGVNESSEYYIAVTGAPYIYSTCGGLDVNADMQVLNADGSAVEGLYAVGTDSMGVLFTNKKGYANYGGCAQGYCFVSGRIAGQRAAEAAK